MLLRVRYLAFGTLLALATTGAGLLLSRLLDVNWVVISVLLLVLMMLVVLSNGMSSAGGGPTMRPSAGGSNPWSVTTSSLSLRDIESMDHMMEESQRQDPRPLPEASPYRWMVLPSLIALAGILASLFV